MYQVAWQALADKAEAMPLDGNPDVVVCLALEISRELRLEGYAREINRHLQDVRKKKNFAYDARVDLAIHISGEWQAAFAAHRDWIFEQLLVVDCTEQVENPDVAIEDKNGALQAVLTVHE